MPESPRASANTDRALLLTPPGAGAIAVVRLLGPGVDSFLRAHFSRPVPPGRCVHGDVRDGAEVIDDAVVVRFDAGDPAAPGPAVDVSLHGGAWVVRSFLDLVGKEGFMTQPDREEEKPTPADAGAGPGAGGPADGAPAGAAPPQVPAGPPGVPQPAADPEAPVPLDAVDGASLLEREVNAHLGLARTELGVRVLLNQAQAWADLVRRATPGPGDEAHLARWLQKADGVKAELSGIRSDRGLWWLLHPPRVAIAGAPNVGKSTLANQLFARQRVITADLPGTTRDWVGEVANLDGLAVMLVDTPGVRPTADPIEAEAIARSGEQVRAADLVVVVIDATLPLDGEQAAVLEAWPDALRVINKVDAPGAADLPFLKGVRTAATTGQGIDALRQQVRARFGLTPGFDERWPRWWTPRQLAVLEEAIAGRVELVARILNG